MELIQETKNDKKNEGGVTLRDIVELDCVIGRYMYVGRMVLFSYANTVIQEKRGNVSEERKQIGKRYVGCS